VVGLLTHTQLVEALSRGGPEQTVGSSMRANITPLSPGDSLVHAQNRLNEERVDALPVEEAGQFVGLVTSRDIAEVFQLASRWPGFSERATRALPS
jgi:CBS domain-containing protein